jgi:hypothetical protein
MGEGTGCPSRRRPSMWKRIASCMFLQTSSMVAPVETQPGKSGEYAENPDAVVSMTIRYLVTEACLLTDAVPGADGQIIAQSARDCHEPGPDRMAVLAVAAAGADQVPTFGLHTAYRLAYLHAVACCRWRSISAVCWGAPCGVARISRECD